MGAVLKMTDAEHEGEVLVKYADELFGVPVAKENRDKAKFRVFQPGPGTPETRHCIFRKEHIKIAQLWLNGFGRSLLLHGPTGAGKTMFVEQIAARLGLELFRFNFTGTTEAADMLGCRTILPNGQIGFEDGVVVTAMRRGGILLLDEVNFCPPEELGALNGILDGGAFRIPTTGELVVPAPTFRIAATANGIDGDKAADYKGIRRQNNAFLDRFNLGIKIEYMSKDEEAANLVRIAPSLSPKAIEMMVTLADAVRKSYLQDESISVTLSTRVLENWAHVMTTLSDRNDIKLATNLKFSLETVMLFRVPKQDRASIMTALDGLLQRNNLK